MYISIDAGGTNTRVAGAADLEHPIFVGKPLRYKNTHNFQTDLQSMIDAARTIAGAQLIKAVGIGVPGFLNEQKTRITHAANLPGWNNKPLVKLLSQNLHCPVFCRTDVAAALLGEAFYGGRSSDFHYIIWGTGIGGGTVRFNARGPEAVVVNWRLHFEAWEANCGGRAIAKKFGKPTEELNHNEWLQVLEAFRRYLISYIRAHKPPAIIFGGGLAQRHEDALRQLGQELGVLITVTRFGQDGGLIGGFGIIKAGLEAY